MHHFHISHSQLLCLLLIIIVLCANRFYFSKDCGETVFTNMVTVFVLKKFFVSIFPYVSDSSYFELGYLATSADHIMSAGICQFFIFIVQILDDHFCLLVLSLHWAT